MADLTYFQKYPKADEDQSGVKSIRLDHPNWGDVLRTVYAKGVITDFELVENEDGSGMTDPLTVVSRVKVQIGDEDESDFIPLFFNPKAQYWNTLSEEDDTPETTETKQATYFNQEGKYFEKAWMSFRGGDEVVVLMRATEDDTELKPFAVVGFADGVPRIGEHIVKVEYTTLHYLDDEEFWSYYGPPNAGWVYLPNWSHYVEYLPEDHFRYLRMQEHQDCHSDDKYKYYGNIDEEKLGPDDVDLVLTKEITNAINDSGNEITTYTAGYVTWVLSISKNYTRYVIPVGPILYLVEYLWQYVIGEGTGPGGYPGHHHTKRGTIVEVIVQTGLNSLKNYEAAINTNTKTPIQRHNDYYDYSWDYEWSEVIDGFYMQESLECLKYVFYNFNYAVIPYISEAIPDMGNLKFYVRPHTKEELIAADMWPKEEGD